MRGAMEQRTADEKAHGMDLALEAGRLRMKAVRLLLDAESAGDLQGALI
jgi:hypothetical protein